MSKNYKQIIPVADDSKVLTQFGVLPLSVLELVNSDKWDCAYFPQDKAEQRRGDDAEYLPGLGMSEFSSAVCEFIIKYWTMRNAVIVDPFAGRATRAVIADKLGRLYTGYEISPKTHQRSFDHYKKVGVRPHLWLADGCAMKHTQDNSAHACVTCPPYGSLEKYETVEGQLSDIKEYDQFLKKIRLCITNVHRVLRPGGFACWVVGDWRDSNGYHMFTNDVINCFRDAEMLPHDTVIIKNNSPFAALMAYKCACKRISAKIHETLLVFRKPGELDVTGLVPDAVNEKAKEFFEL